MSASTSPICTTLRNQLGHHLKCWAPLCSGNSDDDLAAVLQTIVALNAEQRQSKSLLVSLLASTDLTVQNVECNQ
jgi:hypothetical protein